MADQGKLLSPLVSEAWPRETIERQSQYVRVNPGMAGAAFGAPNPPPPPAEPRLDPVDQLRKLAGLRDAGSLTEEFATQKAMLLHG